MLAVPTLLYNEYTMPALVFPVPSGPLLAGLTQAYVDAINAGAVPTIATAWQVGGCPLNGYTRI